MNLPLVIMVDNLQSVDIFNLSSYFTIASLFILLYFISTFTLLYFYIISFTYYMHYKYYIYLFIFIYNIFTFSLFSDVRYHQSPTAH